MRQEPQALSRRSVEAAKTKEGQGRVVDRAMPGSHIPAPLGTVCPWACHFTSVHIASLSDRARGGDPQSPSLSALVQIKQNSERKREREREREREIEKWSRQYIAS